jgi:hypothetical protein
MYPNRRSSLQKALEKMGFDFNMARSQLALFLAIILLITAGALYKQQQTRLHWQEVEGYVSSVTSSVAADGKTQYTSRISYNVRGQTYSIFGGSSSDTPHTGNKERIIYNPANPNQAGIKMSDRMQLLFNIIFPTVGSVFLVYALLGFAFSRSI